jgi:hypothetical protein
MAEIPSKSRSAFNKWTSSRWFLLSLAGLGFLLPLIEPFILLLAGNNIANSLWPHAIRSLSWSFTLREYSLLIFLCSIALTTTVLLLLKHEPRTWVRNTAIFFSGSIIGMILVFVLLDIAYLCGAFLLLPTLYGIILFNLLAIAGGIPKIPQRGSKLSSKINRSLHVIGVLIAVWLVIPGLTAFAGLSPTPPEAPSSGYGSSPGPYDTQTTVFPYPMPDEVEEIRGTYEEDIEFSIHLTVPQNTNFTNLPLAIIAHGFANPFFETYVDWIEHLAAKGMVVAFIQYPSDVWPEGADDFELVEKDGMSNHPFHLPRNIAINSALQHLETLLEPNNVNPSNLLIGGHSLGAGYALVIMDKVLQLGWGNETLFIDLETPYARPVQDHLQVNISAIPEHMMAHIVVSEDDMSVNDCFGVHHQVLLNEVDGAEILFMQAPSDRYGFPRLVATHYLQASQTHDTLADWAFYRRVDAQADWVVSRSIGDTIAEENAYLSLIDSAELRYMGEWSDGTPVKEMSVYSDAINDSEFEYCKDWIGPD